MVPGIHPYFYIGSNALNHTEQYTEAATVVGNQATELVKKTEIPPKILLSCDNF